MDSQGRADVVERHVVGTYARRWAGMPGTGLGSPVPPSGRVPRSFVGTWNYWWQAHLVEALLDAEQRRPDSQRRRMIRRIVRTVRLRNGGWTNVFHDDMAWFALASIRAEGVSGRAAAHAVRVLTDHLRSCRDADGVLTWRHDDRYRNAPTNGAAAILFARTGDVDAAATTTEWLLTELRDPATGLVVDGIQGDGRREGRIWTYNQGVTLGALVELAVRTGAPRWAAAAQELVVAIRADLTREDVVAGAGGGDGGLFAGILVRHLALAAHRLGDPVARTVVLGSADAAWRTRDPTTGTLSADWRRPADVRTDRDLSVQLGGWIAIEAAAALRTPG